MVNYQNQKAIHANQKVEKNLLQPNGQANALINSKRVKKPIEKLCRYISGTFSKAQLNYPVHEKELYAALKTLKKWRIDLLPKEFTLNR